MAKQCLLHYEYISEGFESWLRITENGAGRYYLGTLHAKQCCQTTRNGTVKRATTSPFRQQNFKRLEPKICGQL